MKGLEVLLVDDEIEFITTLSERLMLRGIQTSMATDGESALRRIEKDPPDVVIMDLLMPGINGLELLKQIGSRNPDVSVILLSGRGNEEDCQEGKLRYRSSPLSRSHGHGSCMGPATKTQNRDHLA